MTKDKIEDVLKDVKEEKLLIEFSEFLEKWNSVSEDERIEKIKLLKNVWNEKRKLPHNIEKITLPAKSGKWLHPKLLIFSKEYKPTHNLENIAQRGLCDIAWLEFLDPRLIDKVSEEEKEIWKDFLRDIGVEKILEDRGKRRQLAERIAVLTVKYYEENKRKRKIKELGASEKLGYDIISLPDTEEITGIYIESLIGNQLERFIEVKGSTSSEPSITLTSNEWRILLEKKEKYYIYLITDTLANPKINIINSKKMLELQEFLKYTITPSKWKDVVETIDIL